MKFRVATFNIENLDDKNDGRDPSLEERLPFLKEAIIRLDADILCLQEIHGQELPDHDKDNPKRALLALEKVIDGTPYENYYIKTTLTNDDIPYDVRNLVILSKYEIEDAKQLKNNLIGDLEFKKITAVPISDKAEKISWERPIQYLKIKHNKLGILHVINLHLKSRLSTNIKGQKKDRYTWKSAAGWAEGFYLSSMKRVGQALETRILIDSIFKEDSKAKIIVCGDFNAEPGEVPVEAICGSVENTNNPDLRRFSLIPISLGIGDSRRYTHLHYGKGNLLDHILISQTLLPYFSHSEIHNEVLHDESLPYRSDKKYPESDHAGFVSEFKIKS